MREQKNLRTHMTESDHSSDTLQSYQCTSYSAVTKANTSDNGTCWTQNDITVTAKGLIHLLNILLISHLCMLHEVLKELKLVSDYLLLKYRDTASA
jgi:hypothetical protein